MITCLNPMSSSKAAVALKRSVVAGLVLFTVSACGGNGGGGNTGTGSSTGTNTDNVDPCLNSADPNCGCPVSDPTCGEEEIVDLDPTPSETLPDNWFRAPGVLDTNSSSVRTSFGFVSRDINGDITEAAPGIRFPINEGPAFPNSQRLGHGGEGFPTIGLPKPPPGQNSVSNYSYPWKDNFCEYRQNVSQACPTAKGHYGQDIRPATCENGKYLVVAPEEITIRTIGSNHGVLAMGNVSEHLYSFLHLERPLPLHPRTGQRVKVGDTLFEGEVIGQLSSRTDFFAGCGAAAQYCTTLHLHFEIWTGANGEAWGSWAKGTAPLPPYTSLISSYERLLDSQPAGADWVNAKPLVDSNLCKPPSLR